VRGLVLKLVPNQGKLEARLKGPSITPGYWLAEAATKDSFDEEGFYKMGDALRPVDPDDLTVGFFFDGRVAENFKLQTGTWVAVGALRAQLVNQFGGLLQDVVIVGENKPYLGAIGLLSLQEVAAQFPQLAGASLADAADHKGLQDRLAELLAAHGRSASGSSNRVVAMNLMRTPPSLDRGELTDKGSVNQRAVIANRPEEAAKIFTGAADILPAS
jgi:feruloyl-CoA synthase